MDGSSDSPAVPDLPVLDRPWVEVLAVPERVARTLEELGVVTLRDVVLVPESRLLSTPNFGRTSLRQLRGAVEDVIEDGRLPIRPFADIPAAPTPEPLSVSVEPASPVGDERDIESRWLDLPWDEGLDVPVRVYNVLRQCRVATVRDVLGLSDEWLIARPNFGRKSLRDLRRAIEDARRAVAGGRLPWSPRSAAPEPFMPPEDTPVAPPSDLLDRPWDEALDVTVRVANGLSKTGAVTVRDVLALTDRQLLSLPWFGRTSLRDLKAAIQAAQEPRAAGGPPTSVAAVEPARPLPADLASLAAEVRGAINLRDRRVFELYWSEGWTLEAIGAEVGVTRERIRQRLSRCERRAARLGRVIRAVLEPVLERMEMAGGLLHVDEVHEVAGPGPIEDVPFMARAAGLPDVRVWEGRFLTSLSSTEVRRRLGAVREALRRLCRDSVPVEQVAAVMRDAGGLTPGPAGFAALLGVGLGLEPDGDVVTLDAILRPGGRLIATLANTGRPVRVAELAALIGLVGEDDDATGTPAHRVQAVLDRYGEAWKIGPATYVHRDHLPVPEARLMELARETVERLEASPGPVGLVRLARDFQDQDPSLGGLTANLLGAALARHPALVIRYGRVGLAELFHAGGVSIARQVAMALDDAGRVLCLDEVVEAVNADGLDYTPASIQNVLLHHPGVLVLGEQRFLARSALPVGDDEVADLCGQALDLLPEDGLPVVARHLLRPLSAREWNRGVLRRLAVEEDPEAVLWALLRQMPDIEVAGGFLVARRVDGRQKGMVWGLLLKAFEEVGAASQAGLIQHLGNRHGWSRTTGRLANILDRMMDDGVVVRLPGSVYVRPEAADEKAFEALRHHHQAILRAGCPVTTGTREMGILARYLYWAKEWGPLAGVLDRLLTRGDLGDPERREFGRLQQVVRANLEDVE